MSRSLDFGPAAQHQTIHQKWILACGVLAPLLYVAMNIVVPLFDPTYNSASQTISELSAIEAPTRALWVSLGIPYTLLVAAFGWGVWSNSNRSRQLKVAGALLIASGLLGAFWPPMHQREVLAAGGKALTDVLHIAFTMVSGAVIMTAMGFASAALGGRFRMFSIVSIVTVLAFGMISGLDAPNIDSGLPTPLVGIWERISAGAMMLWLAVFALALWRLPEAKGDPRSQGSANPNGRTEVFGFALPGFEGVRHAFEENFASRNELGAACCIYLQGEKVVDLWGGVRDRSTGEPWEKDTMVVVFSAPKGMAAMALALARSRGLIDYDEPVCAYWPEFAQNGKERMTVRQLLAHQGGLFAFHEKVDRATIADLDLLAEIMAREKPEWEPGQRQAYHAITLGFYEGELIRRVDPEGRSLGTFFQEEIASPLELDFFIRLPEMVPSSRLAVLDRGNPIKMMAQLPRPVLWAALNPRSPIYRALMVNPGSWVVLDADRVYIREVEVPSGGGVGTARAIARAYSDFATGGHALGLGAETLAELIAPATPSAHGFFDEGLRGELQFSLGFMKPSKNWPFGHEGAFGSPGAGGALGYADPLTGLAYAYVTNRMGTVDGDPRDLALRAAIPDGC